jgi:hypothetical protein
VSEPAAPNDGDLDEAMRLTLLALPLAFAIAPRPCNAAYLQLGQDEKARAVVDEMGTVTGFSETFIPGPYAEAASFEPLRHISFIGMGCAHFAAGRYDRAVRWVESGVAASRGSFWAQRVAVAAAAMMGAHSEARRMGLQVMRKDPDLTVAEARQAWPFTPEFMSRLGDGRYSLCGWWRDPMWSLTQLQSRSPQQDQTGLPPCDAHSSTSLQRRQ